MSILTFKWSTQLIQTTLLHRMLDKVALLGSLTEIDNIVFAIISHLGVLSDRWYLTWLLSIEH